MRFLEILPVDTMMQTLGWMLLHSLWQGAIIGVLLSAALEFLRKSTASVRYLLTYTALILMIVLPVGTVLLGGTSSADFARKQVIPPVTSTPINLRGPAELVVGVPAATTSSWKHSVDQKIEVLLPWLILVWMLGVVISSVRLYRGWTDARQLMFAERNLIPHQRQSTLERLMKQLRVARPVLLIESSLVRVPTVVGWLRPMILLPASTLTGLTPPQLETILIHELAHIRRNDYLLNLVQTVIETLLFYHPAVWWASSRIRVEREDCCDDLTVSTTGDATVYARALTEMERLRRATPSLAMAANGGSLTRRIHRLVRVEPLPATGLRRGIFVVIAVVAVIMVSSQAPRLYTSLAASTRQAVSGSDSAAGSNLRQQENASSELLKQARELNSSSPEKRAMAICSLGKSNNVAAIPLLVRALADDAPLSASTGCWDSGSWTPALSTFKQPSPGEEAAMALAAFGEAAVDSLVAALQDSNPIARRNAAWAVGEIRGGLQVNRKNAIPVLFAALSDDDPWVRRAAAFSFGEIRDERATAVLIGRLGDNSPAVREMAARALGEMKASSAFRALTVAITDQDKKVSAAAKWALTEILDE